MRPSSRDRILAAALQLSADSGGREPALHQIADAAGVTKQGLLYHFPDRAALRQAMLELIFEQWEQHMAAALGAPLEQSTVGERISAYARVAARGHVVAGETSLYADLVHRTGDLSWYDEWARKWFFAAEGSHSPRLLTAWLAANALWSALTSRKLALDRKDVEGVLAQIDELVA